MFDFEDEALEQIEYVPPAEEEPVLICFYSGGFFHNDGVKLLSGVFATAASVGIEGMALGFPDNYGYKDEGHDAWKGYVDELVDEIDSQEAYCGRPIILFGHSRGCAPCMSLATRLGSRVKKIYVAACTDIPVGAPSPWEGLSKNFKKGGDKELIGWFASLSPGNILLERTASLPEAEIPDALEESKWLKKTVTLMRLQYRDAMFPKYKGDDPDIKVVDCPLVCAACLYDQGATKKTMAGWANATRGKTDIIETRQGHMDCLDANGEFMQYFKEDLAQFVPKR